MRKNNVPAFWGRALTGNDALTAEEAVFLKGIDCKIALLLNDLTESAVSSNDGGAKDGQRAVDAAIALGVPQNEGIVLFAEIKSDWSVNHNWMIDYAEVLTKNGFLPGFIGNTDSSKNFSFDRECGHFVEATQDVENYHAVFWATEPETEKLANGWCPYTPSVMTPEQISFWSNSEPTRYQEIAVDPVYARDEAVLEYLW